MYIRTESPFGEVAVARTTAAATPAAALAVETQLPAMGPGYYTYDPAHGRTYDAALHRFGTASTIQAIRAIAAAWHRAHPTGPPVGIGDISLRGGQRTNRHAGHNRGLEVDIRPLRRDGGNHPVNIFDPNYSRDLTQQLVNAIRQNGVLRIRAIFFNDPGVQGVTALARHDDHLHVAFLPPMGGGEGIPPAQRAGVAPETREAAVISRAIAQGIRDENRLTDLVFHARHPERRGTRLTPRDGPFVAEWKDIRGRLVRPAVLRAAQGQQSTAAGNGGAFTRVARGVWDFARGLVVPGGPAFAPLRPPSPAPPPARRR